MNEKDGLSMHLDVVRVVKELLQPIVVLHNGWVGFLWKILLLKFLLSRSTGSVPGFPQPSIHPTGIGPIETKGDIRMPVLQQFHERSVEVGTGTGRIIKPIMMVDEPINAILFGQFSLQSSDGLISQIIIPKLGGPGNFQSKSIVRGCCP